MLKGLLLILSRQNGLCIATVRLPVRLSASTESLREMSMKRGVRPAGSEERFSRRGAHASCSTDGLFGHFTAVFNVLQNCMLFCEPRLK